MGLLRVPLCPSPRWAPGTEAVTPPLAYLCVVLLCPPLRLAVGAKLGDKTPTLADAESEGTGSWPRPGLQEYVHGVTGAGCG